MKRRLLLGIDELGIHRANSLGGKTQQPLHELDAALRIRGEKCRELVAGDPPDQAFAAGDHRGTGTGRIENVHLSEGVSRSKSGDQKRSLARSDDHMEHPGEDEMQAILSSSLLNQDFTVLRPDEFSE